MAIGMKTWKPSIYDWERSELQRTNETARALGQEGLDPEQIRSQTMGTLDAEGKYRMEDAKFRWEKQQYWNNLRAQWSKEHGARKEAKAAAVGKLVGFATGELMGGFISEGAKMGSGGTLGGTGAMVSSSNRALGDEEWAAGGYSDLPLSEQESINEEANEARKSNSAGGGMGGSIGSMVGGGVGSMFGPIGTIVGSFLGNMVGGAVGGSIGTSSGGSVGGGGGLTVICTELHRQGYLDDRTIYLDCLYGDSIDYDVWLGYYRTFLPLIGYMRKSKLLTKVVYLLAKPVIQEMAHRMDKSLKGTIRGKIVLNIGEPLCAIKGYMLRRKLWAVS